MNNAIGQAVTEIKIGNIKQAFDRAKSMAEEVKTELSKLKDFISPILKSDQLGLETDKAEDKLPDMSPFATEIEELFICLRVCRNTIYTIRDRLDI